MHVFEMASGLRVKFHKRFLMGSMLEKNSYPVLLDYYYVGSVTSHLISLVYRSVQAQDCHPWSLVVKAMKGRLYSWKSRQLSLGRRITSIN